MNVCFSDIIDDTRYKFDRFMQVIWLIS